MPRLTEAQRDETVNGYIQHWKEIDQKQGSALEILPGLGVAQVEGKRQAYHQKQNEIRRMEEVLLAKLRADRDALFGTDPLLETGTWFWLSRYKSMARARLKPSDALSKTIPNMGRILVERYPEITQIFLEHWTQVNAVLTPPLTLGQYTLADLQQAHQQLVQYTTQIFQLEKVLLPLARAERERIYGDVPEIERDSDSIITTLLLYRETVQSLWPNHPYSQSLPPIFPAYSQEDLPTFAYNWAALPSDAIETWFEFPQHVGESVLYLQEGVVERFVPLAPVTPNKIVVTFWDDIVIVDGIDRLELRDAKNTTLFIGRRNLKLSKPA